MDVHARADATYIAHEMIRTIRLPLAMQRGAMVLDHLILRKGVALVCAFESESCLTFGIGCRLPHFPMKVFAAIAALLLVAYVTGKLLQI